jgi:Glycosyltransferase like family 2
MVWPVALLLFEVFCACLLPKKTQISYVSDQSICVLIPAHNEADGIAKTIRSVKDRLKTSDRILVVSDNCNDETSFIARAEGVEVIERNNSILRGKGYALAFGVEHLKASPPGVVIIIDADCLVVSGTLTDLAAVATHKQAPVQANNKMQWPETYSTSVTQRIAGFAWVFKNYIRPLGLSNAGLPCQLMGTGMAIPWRLISQLELGTGEIVEDVKFGLDCCIAGAAPEFFPSTEILSYFPTERKAEQSQRTRWEHGHVFLVLRYLPKVVVKSLQIRNPNLFLLASDLAILPLALLALATVTGVILAASNYYLSGGALALTLTLFNLCGFVSAVLLGWWYLGRSVLRARDLILVPVYIFSKLPIYLKLILKRQTEWIRTKRDGH